MHYHDLQEITENYNRLTTIGWIDSSHDFTKGKIEHKYYIKLKTLLINPWQALISPGVHECEFCQFDKAVGSKNLLIANKGIIYYCPELILHYIACHEYLPPNDILISIMEYENSNGVQYYKKMKENGYFFYFK